MMNRFIALLLFLAIVGGSVFLINTTSSAGESNYKDRGDYSDSKDKNDNKDKGDRGKGKKDRGDKHDKPDTDSGPSSPSSPSVSPSRGEPHTGSGGNCVGKKKAPHCPVS